MMHSEYLKATGIFTGRRFSAGLLDNVATDCAAKDGAFDHLSQRVDVTDDTLPVIDYQPPAPADTALLTWSWNAAARCYLSAPTLAGLKALAIEPITAQLNEIDQKVIRPAGEIAEAMAAAASPPAESVSRLVELNSQKAALRARIQAINSATDTAGVAAA